MHIALAICAMADKCNMRCTQCLGVIDIMISVHCIEVNNNKIINMILGLIKKIAKPHHPDEPT